MTTIMTTIKRKPTWIRAIESYKKKKSFIGPPVRSKRKLSEREIKACKVWGKNLRLINPNTIT